MRAAIESRETVSPAPSATSNEAFALRTITLPYSLGEVKLFHAEFQLWVWTKHFMRAVDDDVHPTRRLAVFISSCMVRNGGLRGDGLEFPSYPTPSRLARLAIQEGYLRFVRSTYRRFIVDLTGTFAEYENKFSAKTRSTLRRKVRKFADLCGGEPEWTVHRTASEMDQFYAMAREVSSRTYQETLLDVGLPISDEFRDGMKRLAQADAARGYLLFHQGRPIAYVFCPVVEGAVIYQYVGFDPAYREYSAGTVLQYLLLKSLFLEGKFRMFDFTEGEGPHKELFSTRSVTCADLYFLRPTARNVLLIILQILLSSSSKAAVFVLKKLNLHKRVKALVRLGWKQHA